jgi:hypothetical protein
VKLMKLERSFVRLARRGARYPRRAPTVAVGATRRLRCGARGTRAAAMPLASGAPAPLLHGFSPVRPWRAGLPLVPLRSSPRHKSPTPGTAHRAAPLAVVVNETSVHRAKPRAGVRRQRHCAALRTAGRMAARAQRAHPHLTRVDCPSTANKVSGVSFDEGHAIEDRKGVGLQGRPPCTSAGAYPLAALPRSTFNSSRDARSARRY